MMILCFSVKYCSIDRCSTWEKTFCQSRRVITFWTGLFINARSFRSGPFFIISQRRSLHRWTSDLIKRINPIVLGRKITFNIAWIIIQCTCLWWLVYMVDCIMQRRHGLGRVSKISRRKRKLNTCTDMLLDPNAFQCQILPSCSGPLWME